MGLHSFRRYVLIECLVVVLTFATALISGATFQAAGNSSFAFVHVTVIDGTGAPAQPNQTVLVSGDRITAVGPSAGVPIPRGVRAIDATGRYLIPGLWDAHVHTRYEGIDHLRLLVAHGITSTRNMSGPWQHLPEIHSWRQEIAKRERIGPRLLTAGPVIDGPGSGRPTNVEVNNADEARQAVRRVKSEGADFVKVYNLLSRESYFAIAAEAKAQGLPFVGHIPIAVGADEASDAGQLSVEHMDGILWSSSAQEEQVRKQAQEWRPGGPGTPGPVSAKFLFESFSVIKLRALAERLKKNQTAVVPTLSLYRNRFEGRNDRSAIAAADRLRYVPPAYAEEWKRLQLLPPALARRPTTEEDERLQFQQCLTVVRELHKAGVRILAGTDVGTSFQIPGISLHDELSLLVQAGLSTMDALQAATRNPARAFKLADQGTIEKGMRGDLLLLDSNPLDNIENIRKIGTVVAAGRVFERNELDAILADIQRVANQWTGTPTR